MAEIFEVPEQIAEQRIIVYKSRIDPSIVKLTAEKMKSKIFPGGRFSKPRSEEIAVVSVNKHYARYVLVDANYHVDYYKERVYTLNVDSASNEVRILDQPFKPDTVVDSTGESRKVVELKAKMCFSHQQRAYVVFDENGREIPPEKVPSAPSEENPQKILKERAGHKKVEFSSQKELQLVKARLIQRPAKEDEIENELFDVSELALIFSPIYEIKFRERSTGDERTIMIDGVTAKVTGSQ